MRLLSGRLVNLLQTLNEPWLSLTVHRDGERSGSDLAADGENTWRRPLFWMAGALSDFRPAAGGSAPQFSRDNRQENKRSGGNTGLNEEHHVRGGRGGGVSDVAPNRASAIIPDLLSFNACWWCVLKKSGLNESH